MYKTGNLSRWFQQRCSSLFVHQAMNSLNKPVNNTVQAVHVQTGQVNNVEACQQPCSNWPAQSCSSLSTTMFKPVNNHVQTSQLNHVEACQQAKTICAFYVWYMSKKNIEIESTVRTKVLKGLLQIAVSCPHCDAEKELSLSYLFLSPESMSYQSWKRGFVKYRRLSRLINRILGKVFFIFRVWQPTCNRFLRFASFNK